ncbi:MAG: aldo/keto reductase, partial [Clostridia bacterium]|nr:aldo/keto reductase [Clostridia bacterium]
MSYEQYVPYTPADDRYSKMPYRRCGRSGLKLPAISLGLWHNFGDITPFGTQKKILRTAFDNGITHFDLANNYGPPYGEAERNFGEHMKRDWHIWRDELVIS